MVGGCNLANHNTIYKKSVFGNMVYKEEISNEVMESIYRYCRMINKPYPITKDEAQSILDRFESLGVSPTEISSILDKRQLV